MDTTVAVAPIGFLSHDGTSTIKGLVWEPERTRGSRRIAPRGVIQIVHGMVEHVGRYDEFARFLVEQGFVVCAADHIGHGKSVASADELGCLPVDGKETLIEDVHELRKTVTARYSRQTPYIMFGHSMGSFVTRAYLARHGEDVAAAVICGVVLLGGVKSIGGFCEKLTPAMCLIYVVGVLGVIIINLEHVPAAFAAIFRYAFAPMPAVGGLAGSTVALALRQGAARGTFSNEAGCGSSPITHATAITDHPFKEGMYGCFEVFVDTLVVCTMTALGILCAGPEIWQSGLEAEALTMAAFSTAYGSTVGKLLVTIPLALFAFSTMVGWEINYESAFFYLFPKGKQSKVFKYAIRILWLVPGFLALGKTPQVIWTIVDIVSGFWCIPNAIALLALSGVFMRIYRDYESKYISKTKPVSQPLEYVGKD